MATALGENGGDIIGRAHLPIDPHESQASWRKTLVPRDTITVALDPPGRAGVAATKRVRGVRSGHEIGRLHARLGRRKGHVDVAEEPGCHSRRLEGRGLHVEVLIGGVESEARDIPVGDADPQTVGTLAGCVGNPADR